MSPSAAALKAVRAIGYDWVAVSGMDYWEYEGTKLCQLGAAPVSELLQDDDAFADRPPPDVSDTAPSAPARL